MDDGLITSARGALSSLGADDFSEEDAAVGLPCSQRSLSVDRSSSALTLMLYVQEGNSSINQSSQTRHSRGSFNTLRWADLQWEWSWESMMLVS